jgi:hypothetical protein
MRNELLMSNSSRSYSNPPTLQRAYFRPEAVRSLLKEHMTGRRNRSGILWRKLILELWHRNFSRSREFASALVSGDAPGIQEPRADALAAAKVRH